MEENVIDEVEVHCEEKFYEDWQDGDEEGPPDKTQCSVIHSHWSRNVQAWISLVESFIVLLHQLSYAIKKQLGHPKPPTRFFMA